MVSVLSLWLPILLSAALVFIVSSVIHMVLPFHKTDWSKLPDEKGFRDALRNVPIPPGDYMIPHATSNSERADPEFVAKYTQGPVAIMTVLPNQSPTMGASLLLWFLYGVVVSIFAAYVAGAALAPGARYLDVFQFSGTVAFVGYGLALLQNSIWYSRQWSSTLKSVFDSLIYALLTAGIFGWLWPAV
jgi:hypothetical protein